MQLHVQYQQTAQREAPWRRSRADEPVALLRTVEVARRFQVSPRTVIAWAQAGKLPSMLTPGGHRRYPADAVEELATQMRNPTSS